MLPDKRLQPSFAPERCPSDKSNHITAETSFQENFTKDKALMGERGIGMRNAIITFLYVISSFIDDFAYWVVGKGEDETERKIKTPWGEHTYCN